MAKGQLDAPGLNVTSHPALKRLDDTGPAAPDDMKPRHAVAGAEGTLPAALGPAHRRKKTHALIGQPAPLLARREVQVRLRPLTRPVVLGPVKARRDHPVAAGQFRRITNTQPALLRRVNQKEAPQRPERLPTQILLAFLIEEQGPLARVGHFGGGHQSGQSGPHHDHVGWQ